MQKFSELMRGNELIVAPVALNPIMARLAEDAGFKAIYLSGGSLGWLKCVTEANLTLPELAQVALDMRAVCQLPIVLDAGGGWGDPVHVHRTIALAEAIAARTDPDFVIIARTNARRLHDLNEALRRAEAFHKAGADMLFVHTRNAEEMRIVGECLPPPLMTFAPPDGFCGFPFSQSDLAGLGYRLAASSGTAFAAMVKAVRQSYECLAQNKMDPFLGSGGADQEMKAAQTASGLERLLEIERRTMKGQG